MKRIRSGSGLGDSIYLRPIAEHFVKSGEQVVVMSDYPDVFRGAEVRVEPFGRNNINVVAHYTGGKSNPCTKQYDDMCLAAGLEQVPPLQFKWRLSNRALVDSLISKAAGRPLILVHGGRAPMARADGFGAELLPDRAAFDAALKALEDCFLVQIGKAAQVYPLKASVSLNGSTTVADLLDLATICDGIVAQCSFAVPLAEVFDRPLLVVWSSRGLSSGRHPYVSSITPQKILSKTTSCFVVDDWPETKIQETASAFRYL